MRSLFEQVNNAPGLRSQAQTILRVALGREGREYLLDLFLGNTKRDEKWPGTEERGSENIFLRAKNLFNWTAIMPTTMEERHPVKGAEKDGDAYVRYWEETGVGDDEIITMALGYSDVSGGEREWVLRVRRPRGGELGGEGCRLSLRSLLNRNMHDGLNGTPAEQDFSLHGDFRDWVTPLKVAHRSHGVLWSPNENTPAVRKFWEGGGVRSELYARNGRYLVRSEGGPNYIEYWSDEVDFGRRSENWRITPVDGPVPDPFKISDGMEVWGLKHRPLNEGPAEINYDTTGREVSRHYFLMGEEVPRQAGDMGRAEKGVEANQNYGRRLSRARGVADPKKHGGCTL